MLCDRCARWDAPKAVFGINFVMLWLLFKTRVNLSPFTKDFRGEEQPMSLKRLIFGESDHFDRAAWIIEKSLLDLKKKDGISAHYTLGMLACKWCCWTQNLSTATSRRTYPVSSAPGSQATSSPVSTWMGDRLGIRDAVGIYVYFKKISSLISYGLLRGRKWWPGSLLNTRSCQDPRNLLLRRQTRYPLRRRTCLIFV